MIYNLSGNVVNDAKMLMWCQTTHLYKLTVHFYHCIGRETRSQLSIIDLVFIKVKLHLKLKYILMIAIVYHRSHRNPLNSLRY